MTAQTRTTNKARFENGDKPSGSDYADMIDSFVALADTTAQSLSSKMNMAGGMSTTTASAASIVADAGQFSALSLNVAVTAAASAGTAGPVPASAQGFLEITVSGVAMYVPYFRKK